ncbi:MAG: selenide, water dikinase SelD [Granulosicoccus sp.]|nr:selenide, water dikinase SelD [Granulosicoccus sp.]
MHNAPAVNDIVLLGGGHSHALLIRQWAMKPMAGIRLTLISRDVLTPYSGMLPGYVAGHYSHDDIHIDLARLCSWAGIRFIESTVVGLEPGAQRVLLQDRPAIHYDCLSIDTGSTPDQSVPGSADHTVPVKPIHLFQSHWQSFLQRMESLTGPARIGVVGSGVGGFELTLAIHHAVSAAKRQVEIHWVLRGQEPLRAQPSRARSLAMDACRLRSIELHQGFDVIEVQADRLLAADGRELALDEIFWVTAAAAPDWPGEAGLSTDKRGFIATNQYLQSQSHADIFASGDIGTQTETPSAKAGVFAVRQAPVLLENLRRFVLQKPLKVYKPQKNFLSLMALGSREAMASRNGVVISGKWVWRWKDHIDRTFMDKFHVLPPRKMARQTLDDVPGVLRVQGEFNAADAAYRCGGCGAKIGSDVLHRVIAELSPIDRDDVVAGLSATDDAAVLQISGGLLVQSVDQFRAMLDEPWLLGRIAALHALNDLYAMYAQPQSAQALITLPFASESILERDLYQIMAGALVELSSAGCALIGGHTGEGTELMVGFSVNGIPAADTVASSQSLRAGDALILTKPLGTGVLLAANMQAAVPGVDLRCCIESMLHSNQQAAAILQAQGSTAVTDVTGFGLLGHVQNLLAKSELGCVLELSSIPQLPGAHRLSQNGYFSSLLKSNRRVESQLTNPTAADDPLLSLLSDPQTSGGLLAAVPSAQSETCVSVLRKAGYSSACIIGYCQSESGITLK